MNIFVEIARRPCKFTVPLNSEQFKQHSIFQMSWYIDSDDKYDKYYKYIVPIIFILHWKR